MFCSIPLPFCNWNDKFMNMLLPCFPIVGAVIGLIWWGVANLLLFFDVNTVLSSAFLTIVPFVLTGFLHLDGFMDTSDAVLSRRPFEEKLRILKDSHTGSFAVVMAIILFLLWFASSYVLMTSAKNLILLVLIAVSSRCCSAFSMMALKPMQGSGYANMLKKDLHKAHIFFVVFVEVAVIVFSVIFAQSVGIAVILANIIGFVAAMAYSYKEFHGVSGDLTGFSLTIAELSGIFVLALICG